MSIIRRRASRFVVAYYPESGILVSGWLLGEDKLYKKTALLDMKTGKGYKIFYEFRVQHKAYAYGTYKLLFNGK